MLGSRRRLLLPVAAAIGALACSAVLQARAADELQAARHARSDQLVRGIDAAVAGVAARVEATAAVIDQTPDADVVEGFARGSTLGSDVGEIRWVTDTGDTATDAPTVRAAAGSSDPRYRGGDAPLAYGVSDRLLRQTLRTTPSGRAPSLSATFAGPRGRRVFWLVTPVNREPVVRPTAWVAALVDVDALIRRGVSNLQGTDRSLIRVDGVVVYGGSGRRDARAGVPVTALGGLMRVEVRGVALGRGEMLLPWLVLAGGLGLSGLMLLLARQDARREQEVLQLVDERTRELDASNAMLQRVAAGIEECFFTGESLPDGAWHTLYATGAWHTILGPVADGDSPDEAWSRAVHPDDRARFHAARADVRAGRSSSYEYRLVNGHGVTRWVWSRQHVRPVGLDGRMIVDGVISDITERKRVEQDLKRALDAMKSTNVDLETARAEADRRSRVDALTGAFNRRHFGVVAEEELRTESSGVAVLLLDVDHFKRINDSRGHRTGDEVLCEVFRRVCGAVRATDHVARWGGEEFVVLCHGIDDDDQLRRVADVVRRAVGDRPFASGAATLEVSVSIGAARPTGPAPRLDALVDAADQALYAAKRHGRNQARLHSELTDRDFGEDDPDLLVLARALALSSDVHEDTPPLHGLQVADLSARVAKLLRLPADTVQRCRLGGWLHDVGKVAIPEALLAKPSRLNADEWAVMQNHAPIGAQIVHQLPALSHAAPAVRHHHERWDGTGYPDGLAGHAIPVEARIVAAVDAFSVITSGRVYRPGRDLVQAVEELRRSAGTQLDPNIVEALCALVTGEVERLPATIGISDAA